MKITASQYAKSLHGAIQEKSQHETDVVIANLFKVLQKNGQMKLARKVVEKFSDLWNKENGIVEAEIATRHKMQDSMVKKIEDFLKEKYRAKEVVLVQKVDEGIKGGIIIKVGDELIDASVERRLMELKKMLMN